MTCQHVFQHCFYEKPHMSVCDVIAQWLCVKCGKGEKEKSKNEKEEKERCMFRLSFYGL